MEGIASLNKDKKYVLDGIVFLSYSAVQLARQVDREKVITLKQPISTVDLYVQFGKELVD